MDCGELCYHVQESGLPHEGNGNISVQVILVAISINPKGIFAGCGAAHGLAARTRRNCTSDEKNSRISSSASFHMSASLSLSPLPVPPCLPLPALLSPPRTLCTLCLSGLSPQSWKREPHCIIPGYRVVLREE